MPGGDRGGARRVARLSFARGVLAPARRSAPRRCRGDLSLAARCPGPARDHARRRGAVPAHAAARLRVRSPRARVRRCPAHAGDRRRPARRRRGAAVGRRAGAPRADADRNARRGRRRRVRRRPDRPGAARRPAVPARAGRHDQPAARDRRGRPGLRPAPVTRRDDGRVRARRRPVGRVGRGAAAPADPPPRGLRVRRRRLRGPGGAAPHPRVLVGARQPADRVPAQRPAPGPDPVRRRRPPQRPPAGPVPLPAGRHAERRHRPRCDRRASAGRAALADLGSRPATSTWYRCSGRRARR